MTAYTQEFLDALQRSIASGVRSVTYRGTTTTYRSLDEMERIEALIQKGLDEDSGLQRTKVLRPYLKRDY